MDLFDFTQKKENDLYLKEQIITYIGNKRALLPFIEEAIINIKNKINKEKIEFLDLFSGTGIVSRMARKHSKIIHCNDLEKYSYITNICYQTNKKDVDYNLIDETINLLKKDIKNNFYPGFITELYAPRDEKNIQMGERVFYTRKNAIYLDSFCRLYDTLSPDIKPYILAPILSQASMYVNTSGVFKGFYKNKNGIGQFGGHSHNALTRITRNISLTKPILSEFNCNSFIYQEDSNKIIRHIPTVDIAYLDPPYNQHPYGSNYFMLNILCDYKRPDNISKVSGIPKNWNRSNYNKRKYAEANLFDVIDNINAKFVLISYNSEGFIQHENFLSKLNEIGPVSVMDKKYNTFRGCRNLSGRDIHVTENLYLVDKRGKHGQKI